MSIESDFFKRSRPDFGRLEPFGFRREGDVCTYSEIFFDDQFRADLQVTEDGRIEGCVMDMETGEEYLPIRLRDQIGGFVGGVREEYLELLGRIKDACFVPMHFIFDQSNRIEAWIDREYSVKAEFPWERYPGNGPFRCKNNDKWFAVLLTVEYGKLTGDSEAAGADEIVEVINLKADAFAIPELIKKPGIFAAWHMNKKHWISVILNDTVPDEAVTELIRKSHGLASKGNAKKVASTGAWMIPSNPKVYDVDAGFRDEGGAIEWHQHNDIKPGDEVFIYCSAPYSALIYRCEVLESDLRYHGMFKDSKGYERSMKIKLIEKYPPDKFPLSFIKEHGGSVVRSARSMPEELYAAIKASN